MRKALIAALAQYAGQELTRDIGIKIVTQLCPVHTIDLTQFETKQWGGGWVFRAERFAEIIEEVHALHVLQWDETERARHGLKLNPDYGHVLDSEQNGQLIQFTARDQSNRLVGNIRFYLFRDVHTSTLAAKEDTFYLMPDVRKGFMAIRFWQYAEACLKQLGVLEVRTDSKILYDADGKVTRNVGRLNEFIGYEHVSNGYLKRLKD